MFASDWQERPTSLLSGAIASRIARSVRCRASASATSPLSRASFARFDRTPMTLSVPGSALLQIAKAFSYRSSAVTRSPRLYARTPRPFQTCPVSGAAGNRFKPIASASS